MRLLPVLLVLGCSDPTTTVADVGLDAARDASADAGFGMTCEAACRMTSLTAAFSTTRTLDRAHYGVTSADGTLHIEAYRGGGTGCPTMSSPTPDYALVMGRVTAPTSGSPSTSPATILDYKADLLGGPLNATATMVTLTPVAAKAGEFVAFDISLTFPTGTITGHLFATHCMSMDS